MILFFRRSIKIFFLFIYKMSSKKSQKIKDNIEGLDKSEFIQKQDINDINVIIQSIKVSNISDKHINTINTYIDNFNNNNIDTNYLQNQLFGLLSKIYNFGENEESCILLNLHKNINDTSKNKEIKIKLADIMRTKLKVTGPKNNTE